jgi:hypothetical protein
MERSSDCIDRYNQSVLVPIFGSTGLFWGLKLRFLYWLIVTVYFRFRFLYRIVRLCRSVFRSDFFIDKFNFASLLPPPTYNEYGTVPVYLKQPVYLLNCSTHQPLSANTGILLPPTKERRKS